MAQLDMLWGGERALVHFNPHQGYCFIGLLGKQVESLLTGPGSAIEPFHHPTEELVFLPRHFLFLLLHTRPVKRQVKRYLAENITVGSLKRSNSTIVLKVGQTVLSSAPAVLHQLAKQVLHWRAGTTGNSNQTSLTRQSVRPFNLLWKRVVNT